MPEQQQMVLEDYLKVSLERRNVALPLYKVQVHILEDLIYDEAAVRNFERQLVEQRTGLAGCASDDARKECQRLIEGLEREVALHKVLCGALRDIADGIAWRLLKYDRLVLSELAKRPGVNRLSHDLRTEALEFEHSFRSPYTLAVLNDLTNFLKIGDVTVRTEDGQIEFVEVKKGGKKSGRITRQKQAMREVVQFLNEGEREEQGQRLVASVLDVDPETNFKEFEEVANKAARDGASLTTLGDHLLITCIDIPNAARLGEQGTHALLESGKATIQQWESQGDVVIPCTSSDKYLNVRHYAPFSIYPLPTMMRVRLMTGSLVFINYLNITAVLRCLERTGWQVERSLDEYVKEQQRTSASEPAAVATVRKGGLSCEVSWQWIGRVGHEFLKPDTIVAMLEAILQRGPHEAQFVSVSMSGEEHMWD
jgi:hypothetical protein